MKIGLIGAGRLGICLALLIEQEGYHVIASDMREDYIKDLQNKKINSTEPQVQELLEHSINLEFTTDNRKVIRESDIIISKLYIICIRKILLNFWFSSINNTFL